MVLAKYMKIEKCSQTSVHQTDWSYIGESVSPHGRMHKDSWISLDRRSKHQIDHVCIMQMFRRSLLDVRVYQGANAASDHYLALAKIKKI